MRKITIETLHCTKLVLAGFAALSAALLTAAPAAAAPIPVTQCGQVLNVPNGQYVLQNDLNCTTHQIALQITANGVQFNGNGHTIKGTGANPLPKTIGIEVVGAQGVGVQNVNLTSFTQGIRVRSSQVARVYNVRSVGNVIGALIADASQISIAAGNYSGNGYFGVYLSTATNCHIIGNAMMSNKASTGFSGGIYVGSSDSNVIADNRIMFNGVAGVWLYLGSDQNIVRRNDIRGTEYTGIASNGTNNTIEENYCGTNKDGIVLAGGAVGHTVRNNTVKGNSHLDMTDENLPGCANAWMMNIFATDSEGDGPGLGCIK
jgi:parallel beta-helix repeat protein